MPRTLNWKLVLGTLAILLVIGIAVHFVHGFQVRRNAGTLLAHADQAKEAGELEQALTYYTHYLTFEPEDTAALAKFGLALDQRANNPDDWLGVVLKFEQVLQRDPGQKEVRLRLVHNLIQLHRFREAIANIQRLLPQADNKADLEHMLGWCYEALKDYPKSADAFGRAVALDPRRVESYVLLAQVLQDNLDKSGPARAVMDDLVRANAESFRVYLIRSKFLQQQSFVADAEADLKKALALAPRQPAVLLAAADWAQAKGDLQAARQWVQKGWELDPGNVAFIKALAALEMRAGRRAEAVAILTAALKDMPRTFELHVLLTELLIDEGKLPEAAAKIEELTETGMPGPLPDYLRGRLAIGRGQWPEALGYLEQARVDLGNNTGWSSRLHALLGLCYHQVGDHDQELVAFRRAVAQDPSWILARLGLGSALLANGLLDEAIIELQLIQNAPDAPPELWTVMARALIERNLRRPEKLRRWEEVETVLARASQKTPAALEPIWLKAEVMAAQNNFYAAKELLEKACAAQPEQLVLWSARADLAARQKHWGEAALLLDQAEKTTGDRAELRLARCRLWGAEGTVAARSQLIALTRNLERFTPLERVNILRELAGTWVRLGEPERAEVLWQRIATEQPRDLRSRFALFESAVHANRLEQARTLLTDLHEIEGESGKFWQFGTAALLVQESAGNPRKLDEARKGLEQLARRQKNWSSIPLLQARIEELSGNEDLAIDHYLAAVELGERQPSHLTRLVQLLIHFKRHLDAEQVLYKVKEQLPLPPELLRLEAEIALTNQNFPEALRLAGQAVPGDSKDYRDYLWLGRVYHAAGADPKAEAVMRQGVALAPHAPDTWIALAEQLTRTGQRGEAAQAIATQAKEKVSSRLALYTEARCFEKMGLPDQAEALYRLALSQNTDDFVLLAHAADFFRHGDEPAKAEPFLEALIKLSGSAPADYVIRARRHLALVVAGKGDISRALALIDGNLRIHPNNPADQRARAVIQAVQPVKRQQAVRLFEETARRQPLSLDEQFQLAQLHDAAGDVPRVREQIGSLLAAEPDNPQFLAFSIRQHLKAEEIDEARIQLQRLERVEPGSARTRELKMKLLKS